MRKLRTSRKTLNCDNKVVLYPSFGHRINGSDSWRLHVCGTVYESGSVSLRKRLLLRLLQKVMKVEPAELERTVFERRIRAFVAPTERGKQVVVRVGEQVHALRKSTKRNGRFTGTVRLAADEFQTLSRAGVLSEGWLKMDILLPGGESADPDGRVQLMENTGVSVISDIDDTIKVTEVHSRRLLLANTFLRDYRPIEGMASIYRRWADQGAAFHYVSSSPWQLYSSLAEMLEYCGFPRGTFHLRSFRLRDHMLRRLLLIRRRGKITSMISLLRTFPERRFVLVGDSGERDPEIYGALARKFPKQVAAVFIRDLPQRPMVDDRRARAFRLAEPRCFIFDAPVELPADLDAIVESQTYQAQPQNA